MPVWLFPLTVHVWCITVAKQAAQGDNEYCPCQPDGCGSLCWLVWWTGLQPSATRVQLEVLLTTMFDTCTGTDARVY